MANFIDLHCHYLPTVDDGVLSFDEGVRLCRGLRELGFSRLIATPHIRSRRYDNTPEGLRRTMQSFSEMCGAYSELPEFGLAAEYYIDELTWDQIEMGKGLYYPGGYAVLVEFPTLNFPFGIAQRFSALHKKKIAPVLAHPERYRAIINDIEAIDPLVRAGALPLLDVMALVGRYGREIQRTAERLLDGDRYFAACTDSHRATDVADVARSLERLRELAGERKTHELLALHTDQVLRGTYGK